MKSNKLVVLGGLAAAGASSFAPGPDFTALTGSIDLTTVGAAILAVAALKVVPLVAIWGSRVVMSMIRG